MSYFNYKKLIPLALFFLTIGIAFGYDNLITHPNLTRAAIEVYNRTGGNKITGDNAAWIVNGSIAEDADPRYLNHFYNPETGQGLNAYDEIIGKVWVQGMSAKEWSKNQGNISGDYSIKTTLDNYRQKNFKRAYEGVGHILHLIQDMSVPAHTRNDPHYAGDPYEGWAQRNGNVSSDVASAGVLSSVDEAFDAVAAYSHYNFWSKDTISGVDKREVKRSTISETAAYIYCQDNRGNIFICVKEVKTPLISYYVDDNEVNKNYWRLLSPEAVSYSASVINYFAEEFKKIDQEEIKKDDLSLWDKIKSEVASITESAKYVWGDAIMVGNVQAAGPIQGFKALTIQIDTLLNNNQAGAPTDQASQETGNGKVLGAEDTAVNSAVKEIVVDNNQITLNIPATNNPPVTLAQNPLAPTAPVVTGKIVAPDSAAKVLDLIANNQIQIFPNLVIKNIASDPQLNSNSNPTKENSTSNIIKITPAPLLPGSASSFVDNTDDTPADNTPPNTVIASAPATITSSTVAIFAFTASEAAKRFEYNFDDVGWEASAANLTLPGLTDGVYSIEARAVDLSDNTDPTPVAYNWTVDTIAPLTFFTSTTSPFSNATTTTFGLSANEPDVFYSCNLDTAGWQACGAATTIDSLSETPHSLEIKSTDLAGNTGTSTIFSWVVDLTPPLTSFVSTTSAFSNATSTTFGFAANEADVSYSCNLDAAGWQSCAATTTLNNLSEATHSLAIESMDLAGNIGSSTAFAWAVDVTAPTSSVAAAATSTVGSAFAVNWSGGDGNGNVHSGLVSYDVEYQINGGVWQAWINATSSTGTIYNLVTHVGDTISFHSRARDLAGNVGGWSGVAPAAVVTQLAFDNAASSNSASFAYTVNAASNTVLLVSFITQNNIDLNDAHSITYNGITMTKLFKTHDTNNISGLYVYSLFNPPQGSHTIAIPGGGARSWNGALIGILSAISFSGVNTAGVIASSTAIWTGSQNFTTTANNYVLVNFTANYSGSGYGCWTTSASSDATTGQTQFLNTYYFQDLSQAGYLFLGSYSMVPTSGSNTSFNWIGGATTCPVGVTAFGNGAWSSVVAVPGL